MQYAEVYNILKSVGIPCAYRFFPDGTGKEPPFMVFYYDGNDDLFADNTNYQTIVSLRIELYTRNKDFSLERNLETVLKNNGITYSKEEGYIETEKVYEIIYESEVVING